MTALVVIAKAPVPGRSKTRLCPPCTPEQAAELAEAALRDTLAAVEDSRGASRRVIVLEGEGGDWLPSGFEVIPQRSGEFAERLAGAAEDVGAPLLIVGMDTPQVTAELLDAALAALEQKGVDACLGPALDGGYWAIGLRDRVDGVFEGVPMSSSETCAAQRARLDQLGLRYTELPALRDVDTFEDARVIANEPAARRFGAALAKLSVLAAALVLAGCGSSETFPPAAEPAVSPPLTQTPAGTVIDLVEGEPEGIVADIETGIVAIGVRNPDGLVLYDGERERFGKTVELSESPRHLQLAGPGGPVLVPAERSNELIEVRLPGGKISSETAVGEFPHDATAVGNRIFVGDEMGDTISVIEAGRVIGKLTAPVQPGGLAAAGELVGVIAVAERVLEVYDANTLESIGQTSAGVGPTHIVAGPEGRFYVTDTQGDALLTFRTEPRVQLVDRVNLPGTPYGIAVDPLRRRLYVALTETNELVEFRITGVSPKENVRFPTVRQPNTVAVDGKRDRVYVASRVDRQLQVIDPDAAKGGPSVSK